LDVSASLIILVFLLLIDFSWISYFQS
jgi:hypothetical protein